MTSTDQIRGPRDHQTDEPTTLSETFVLLDNNSGAGAPSLLFTDPVEIIAADTPEEVPAALERLEAGVKNGLHAAGFFAYELGYVLEPKLVSEFVEQPLRQRERGLPGLREDFLLDTRGIQRTESGEQLIAQYLRQLRLGVLGGDPLDSDRFLQLDPGRKRVLEIVEQYPSRAPWE